MTGEVIDAHLHVEAIISYCVYMCYDYGKPVLTAEKVCKQWKKETPSNKECKFCMSF